MTLALITLFFLTNLDNSKFDSTENNLKLNNENTDPNDSIITGVKDISSNSYFAIHVHLKENKAIKWHFKCNPDTFHIILLIMSSNDYGFISSHVRMLGLQGTIDFWDQCIVSESSVDSGKYHDSADRYYFVFVSVSGSGSVEYEINPNVKYVDWGKIGLIIFGVFIVLLKFALLILKSVLKMKKSSKIQPKSLNDNLNNHD